MKEWPRRGEKCGIYAIENLADGKFYVGQAQCIRARWVDHLRRLRLGKHSNSYLKHAWAKHGEAAFRFFILEECSKDVLDAREQEWLTTLEAVERGYNISPSATTTRGTRRSEASKERLRRTLNSPETKAKKAAAGRKMWQDPSTRDTIVAGIKKSMGKPETQEKILRKLRKSWADPKVRARRSEVKLAEWADPEVKKLRVMSIRETAERPDVREKVIAANRSRSTTRLTQEKVDNIRARYVRGCPTHGLAALAGEFGVSMSTVRRVIARKIWA